MYDPAPMASVVIPGTPLSEREREILRLVAEGMSNREIGRRLHLSEETVKSHVRHILARLCARSRAHAVALAIRSGSI